jgi:lysophospholipase L1-like esterase
VLLFLGADARLTVDRFASYVAAKSPTLVIIGLGLWNERLTRRGRAAVLSFLAGLLELVGLCRAIGAHVIIGGVYPNSKYNEKDYELLLETSKELRKWAHKFGVASTDFLTNVDDGSGKWKPGLMSDFIHPNDSGHRLLFENIDLTQFEALKVKPVPNAKL